MNVIVVIAIIVLALAGLASSITLFLKLRSVAAQRDYLQENIDVEKQKYEEAAARLTKNFNASHAHFMSQALAGQTAKTLRDNMNDTVLASYKRLGQEFLGNVTDQAESSLNDLNFALTDKIWDAFQQLKESYKDSPQILPRCAKMTYTKGSRTIIVVEQEPQVRTVSFVGGKILKDSTIQQSQGETETGYRFTLAFPYVYFIIVFDGGVYTYHEVYFRNKPLSSAREHIYLAPLPNIHRENQIKNMCMGQDFRGEIQNEGTIARQCELVVGDFWQRTFNDHLGTGGHEKVDSRLKNYAVWQDNSQKDPLFILSVSWNNGKTVKGVIESILENRQRTTKLDGIDKQVKKILDDGVGALSERIKKEYQSTKVADLNKEWLDGINRQSLEALVTDHATKVFKHCTKG